MNKHSLAVNYSQLYQFPKFKTVDMEDQSLLGGFVRQYDMISCEYSFANLYCWRHHYHITWSMYKERLLIHDGACNHTLMPVGDVLRPEELALLSQALQETGKSGDIALVSTDYVEANPEIINWYTLEKNRALSDYIYSARRLYELKGVKLHKKKNLIAQFCREWPDYSIQKMTGSLKSKSLGMAEQMLKENKTVNRLIREEHRALREAFSAFHAIGLEGLVLVVNDMPVAFAIFSRLTDSIYCIHYEKSDLRFKGAAQLINQATAEYLLEKCEYLNREQDLGIPGLRQAKRSYDPETIYTTYKLSYRNL